ncbi:MAG: ABC transporter substrate-binding protein [Clostridia bacterium]|nr:ABC transporter substrate-binding protein [Clostridia bacterium]
MKKIVAILLTLLLLFTFVGCVPVNNGKIVLNVNEVTHSIFYSPFYLAIEKGYFEEEGIEIALTNGGGSNVSMTAVISGQAEIGLVGPETVVYVYNEGKQDYPLVFAKLTQRDGSFLISKEKIDKFDFSIFEGKEILAGRKGGLPAMTLEYVLNKNGLYDGQNVKLNYDVAFNLMAGAYESGTGDYTTLFEPTASDFVKEGKGYIISSVGEHSGEVPYTCFVANKSFIDKNPEIIKSFIRALKKAKEYMSKTPSLEVAKYLLPQFSGNTVEQIAASIDSYLAIDAWSEDFILTKDSFERLLDIMENAGELTKRVPFEDVIFNDIAESLK